MHINFPDFIHKKRHPQTNLRFNTVAWDFGHWALNLTSSDYFNVLSWNSKSYRHVNGYGSLQL